MQNGSINIGARAPKPATRVLAVLAAIGAEKAGAEKAGQVRQRKRGRESRTGPILTSAARIKPVVIDESLIDLESLLAARELGYSGLALKACKGQSGALLMGATAQKYGTKGVGSQIVQFDSRPPCIDPAESSFTE